MKKNSARMLLAALSLGMFLTGRFALAIPIIFDITQTGNQTVQEGQDGSIKITATSVYPGSVTITKVELFGGPLLISGKDPLGDLDRDAVTLSDIALDSCSGATLRQTNPCSFRLVFATADLGDEQDVDTAVWQLSYQINYFLDTDKAHPDRLIGGFRANVTDEVPESPTWVLTALGTLTVVARSVVRRGAVRSVSALWE